MKGCLNLLFHDGGILCVCLLCPFHIFSCAPDWESPEDASFILWLLGLGFFLPVPVILVASAVTVSKLDEVRKEQKQNIYFAFYGRNLQ